MVAGTPRLARRPGHVASGHSGEVRNGQRHRAPECDRGRESSTEHAAQTPNRLTAEPLGFSSIGPRPQRAPRPKRTAQLQRRAGKASPGLQKLDRIHSRKTIQTFIAQKIMKQRNSPVLRPTNAGSSCGSVAIRATGPRSACRSPSRRSTFEYRTSRTRRGLAAAPEGSPQHAERGTRQHGRGSR